MSDEQRTRWDRWADSYEAFHSARDVAPLAQFLAAQASDGTAWELGIGTGQAARAVAAHGVSVQGVDLSPEMVAQCNALARSHDVPVLAQVGDMASFDVPSPQRLIYCVFSTFYGLLTPGAQHRCLESVARALADDGTLVIDGFNPLCNDFIAGRQRVDVRQMTDDALALSAVQVDSLEQRVSFREVTLSMRGVEVLPVEVRWVWPSELDLMARAAGLALRARFGGYGDEPARSSSRVHVSVYEHI